MRPPGYTSLTGRGSALRPALVRPQSTRLGPIWSEPPAGRVPGDASGWAVAPVARGSVALFLALYLLLLAFFIMLTALSSLETKRAGAVMDSLGETFRQAPAAAAPTEAPMPMDVLDAERRAAEAFLSVVRDLFEGTVPGARVDTISAGRAAGGAGSDPDPVPDRRRRDPRQPACPVRRSGGGADGGPDWLAL